MSSLDDARLVTISVAEARDLIDVIKNDEFVSAIDNAQAEATQEGESFIILQIKG